MYIILFNMMVKVLDHSNYFWFDNFNLDQRLFHETVPLTSVASFMLKKTVQKLYNYLTTISELLSFE